MKMDKWIEKNTSSLKGHTVAMTGSTGGIGKELSEYIAALGANIILLDRNKARSEENKMRLSEKYPDILIECVTLDG